MRKIWNFIINIPKDKLLHLLAGLLVSLYVLAVASFFLLKAGAVAFADVVTFLVLLGKEIYDLFSESKGHSFEWADVVYGLVGVGLGNIPAILLLLV